MKRIRIITDTWSALFWIAVGLLVCYGAGRLGLGRVTDPGSGFIFFWSGLILVILSLLLFGGSLSATATETQEIQRTKWERVSLVLALLVAYALMLEKIGFVFATFGLLSFLLRLSEVRSWPRVVSVASAVALGSFAVFELWLKIRLPKGVLGF